MRRAGCESAHRFAGAACPPVAGRGRLWSEMPEMRSAAGLRARSAAASLRLRLNSVLSISQARRVSVRRATADLRRYGCFLVS